MNYNSFQTKADELRIKFLERRPTTLTEMQNEKFKDACLKCIIENPDLEMSDLLIAVRIYLNFILDFPELDLGQIKEPL